MALLPYKSNKQNKKLESKMTGKVIAFVNQKGGVGKTTSSINTACMLASMGYSVELINLDPQGTALDWAEARAEQRPESVTFRVSSMGKNVQKDLGCIKTNTDFIIIDGAPQATELTVAAIKAADIVVMPLQPSQADVWSTDSTVDFIQQIHEMRDQQKPTAVFLPVMVLKGSKESHFFSDKLTNGYGFSSLKSRTTQRLAYQRVFVGGGSVLDLPEEDQARHEIKMLTKELLKLAEGIE